MAKMLPKKTPPKGKAPAKRPPSLATIKRQPKGKGIRSKMIEESYGTFPL